jgi:hypothetical protein
VWTDVARWPEWDVSKEIARLDGGAFTITAVDDGRRWVTECPMPLGKVIFDHVLEPVAEGRVRVVKKVEVQGAFGSLLRLMVPKMRRDIAQSLANLERRCPHGLPRAPHGLPRAPHGLPRAGPGEIGGPRETG